jgi:hypothetical protein
LRVLEQVKTPTFDYVSGKFTNSVTLHVSCETDGTRIRYTTDGTMPIAASLEYVNGITLGLGRDGNQTTYKVRAIEMKPPGIGDSLVAISNVIVTSCLNHLEHECESRKYDCFMHMGMVVLKAFDDGTRMRTRQQSSLLNKKWRVPSCVLLAYLFF